jgi:transposase
MMGDRLVVQESFFYQFCLEKFVPSDHMLRAIDRFVDLSDLRRHLGPFYSATGRPSIDPELMIRMLLVGYCLGIRSERRLCEEVHLNLAYRWFCRLGLEGKVPDHSTFSRTATAASGKATRSGMSLTLLSAGASRKVWLAARASRWTPA